MHPRQLMANFDSTVSVWQAIASYLQGADHPNVGMFPKPAAPLLRFLMAHLNKLPPQMRQEIYESSGAAEAITPRNLRKFNSERLARYYVSKYPRRQYQAMMIGSTNGAAAHLCAALGIPWLPQTQLLPVRRSGIEPTSPKDELEWGVEPGRLLLEADPNIQLHHMLDPVQDYLMTKRFAYFRIKLRRLGKAYTRFITRNLKPGGTIFILDCDLKWPTVNVGERQYFQFGGLGGATKDEFQHGGTRVAQYLKNLGLDIRQWDAPQPDGESPEAEWGYASELNEDIEKLANENDYVVRVIQMNRPEHLSPLVADLYRWWNYRRGLPAKRMIVESFMLIEPYWVMRAGAAPFWIPFSTEPFDSYLDDYLDRTYPLDEIGMTLFPHGVQSIGMVSMERWRGILSKALKRGFFIGVDEESFPMDMAALAAYHTDFAKQIKARYPLPGYLALEQLDEFLTQPASEYEVKMISHGPKEESLFEQLQAAGV